MNYKYKDSEVVTLTNNIIKTVEQILKLGDDKFDDAYVGISMEDYSTKLIPGNGKEPDELEDTVEYADYDIYHPYSMDWISFNPSQEKYQVEPQEINTFAHEYVENYNEILIDIENDFPEDTGEFTPDELDDWYLNHRESDD
jgi:hypothetical protein